jgi:excisionase family DNA binding protein
MNFNAYWREDRVLRVHTAARILGCSPRTIRRRILKHEILATRMNRRAWGIRACDLKRGRGGGGNYART